MSKRSNLSVVRTVLAVSTIFAGLSVSPWAAALGMLLLALCWRAYEVLFMGLLFDLVWLPAGHLPYFTIAAIVMTWVFEPLRQQVLS